MSVAVSPSRPSEASSKTFERIGMVFRRSTTLWTWASDRRKAALSMVSFIASRIRVAVGWMCRLPSPAGRRRARVRSRPPAAEKAAGARVAHYSTTLAKGVVFPGFRPRIADRIGSTFDHATQQVEIFREGVIRRLQFLDSPHRVHHRRVVAAAELPADFGQ